MFLILIFFAILKIIIIRRSGPSGLLLVLPYLLNDLFAAFSLYSIDNEDDLLYVVVTFCQIIFCIFLYAAIRISTKSINGLNLLVIKFIHMRPIFGVFFALIFTSLLFTFIFNYDPNIIFLPRETYEHLIESSKNEGSFIFSMLATIATIFSNFCINLPYLLIILPLVFLIGSKGMVVQCIIVFLIAVFFRNKKRTLNFKTVAIFISALLLVLSVFSVTMNLLVRGTDDAVTFLFTKYFDYIPNLNSIIEFSSLMPDQHWQFVINDFIPGYARIAGIDRSDFFIFYFPIEASIGKFPGLLDYENFIRLGFILFMLYYFLKFTLFYLVHVICYRKRLYMTFLVMLMTALSVKLVVILMLFELGFRAIGNVLYSASRKS